MAKVTVLADFHDIPTGVDYFVGDEYESEDAGRLEYLHVLGYLTKDEDAVEVTEAKPKVASTRKKKTVAPTETK